MLDQSATSTSPKRPWRLWRWVVIAAMLVLVALSIGAIIVVRRAQPILKGRVLETLSQRFHSRVELDDLHVSVLRGLEVSGTGLRIFPPDNIVAAGARHPLIAIEGFSFHTGLKGLFVKPMRVGAVHVEGLAVSIPPREVRQQAQSSSQKDRKRSKIEIQVDEIICDDSRLIVETAKPGKDPKVFVLKHIVLHDFGPGSALAYDAWITNAIPRGEIHATGHYGPWNVESPGDSPVNGHYTFDNADLFPIKGIGGTLSSVGNFQGQLNKIGVQGTATVPNFSLDSANRPVPLATGFSATVDGTTGDTYLHQVNARLGHSDLTCAGEIVNVKGQGHIIDLDADVPAGRIQDFLELAVKTRPVIMTGIFHTHTRLHIPPGKVSVTQKMTLDGGFTLRQIHFTNPTWQEKVDELSLRAQGRPQDIVKPEARAISTATHDGTRTSPVAAYGSPDVKSDMKGSFHMATGRMDFRGLNYNIPGAAVQLEGVYTLDGKVFDFRGRIRTEARPSQMVASWWKSLLLKAVDPFLARNGAGMEIPFKIFGTQGAPKFGLDFGNRSSPRR